MLSFYPGPSKIYPQISSWMSEAVASGMLSVNHRSSTFTELYAQMVKTMREKLDVPSIYQIMVASSATECWEIIAESFITEISLHIFNGSFGEKWYEYRQKIAPNALKYEFPIHRMVGVNGIEAFANQSQLICLTQNETSNGTQISNRLLKKIRKRYPHALLCVDATSSMAGIELDWLSADIWFASVQKCFGLPAGMAVMICSQKALEKAQTLGHSNHYNSLIFMHEMAKKNQTPFTPNVLNIFLLNKVLQERKPIKQISHHLKKRADVLYESLMRMGYQILEADSRLRSDTVLTVKGKKEKIEEIKALAQKEGILLGNGYGKWKENTFRIANFPAITDEECEILMSFLKKLA
ncbi:MAG: alanine--glyoxylate aminotransferase family protein [Flammeovirgaceae bacterium]